jgi:hypothetical protein
MTANVTETGSGVNRVCVSYSGGAFAFVLCLGAGYNNPFTVSRNDTRKQTLPPARSVRFVLTPPWVLV